MYYRTEVHPHRSQQRRSTSRGGKEDTTHFAPSQPIRGNGPYWTSIRLAVLENVIPKVRADCDTVIDQICAAAIQEASRPQWMCGLGATSGICESFVFSFDTTVLGPLDYNMLMDDLTYGGEIGVRSFFPFPSENPLRTYECTASSR